MFTQLSLCSTLRVYSHSINNYGTPAVCWAQNGHNEDEPCPHGAQTNMDEHKYIRAITILALP